MVITPSTASGPPPSKMEAIQWEQAARPTQFFIIHYSFLSRVVGDVDPYHGNHQSDGCSKAPSHRGSPKRRMSFGGSRTEGAVAEGD